MVWKAASLGKPPAHTLGFLLILCLCPHLLFFPGARACSHLIHLLGQTPAKQESRMDVGKQQVTAPFHSSHNWVQLIINQSQTCAMPPGEFLCVFIHKMPPSVQLSCFVSSAETFQQLLLSFIQVPVLLCWSLSWWHLSLNYHFLIIFCENPALVGLGGQWTITGLCCLRIWHKVQYTVPVWESVDGWGVGQGRR